MVATLDVEQGLKRGATPLGQVDWQAVCDPAEMAQAETVVADPGAALRVSSPQEAMLRVEPYLADYGVTRVAHLTYLDRVGIPVHTAHKPAGKSLSNGSGKGVTPEASRIGAIMEAIEQTYWEDCDIPRLSVSEEDLIAQGVAHVDPLDLPMMRGNFWNPRLAIEWTPMTDFRTGAEALVPADLVGLPWRLPAKRIAITHICSSNGLASGNNFLEAVLSGLTEVMERDGIAMAAAASPYHVSPESLSLDLLREQFGDPFASLVEKLEAAEQTVSVYDRTGDVGLPTYTCRISESAIGGAGAFAGYGSNLNAGTALVRAVTEAAQARCLIISGARDDQFRCGRDAALLASRHVRRTPFTPLIVPVLRDDLTTGSLRTDIELLTGILADNGMPQVLIHRYTTPSDPVQVVRVVVPRLEGYMFSNYLQGSRANAVIEARLAGTA